MGNQQERNQISTVLEGLALEPECCWGKKINKNKIK